MTKPSGDAAQAIARALTPLPDGPLGVAVSGGSDSLSLLLLAHDLLGPDRLRAVTVDHGLRPEAAGEAAFVARICAAQGIAHTTVHWKGWDGQGNLPDRARRARYALIAEWAQSQGIGAVALGHTADDQAETLLMRLGRGAGAEGLAAMSDRRVIHGVTFLRPLLTERREVLRDLLRVRGQTWVDDPTNDDTRFDRPRLRKALPDLAALGLTVEALTTTARNLRSASDTLAHYAEQEAARHLRIDGPDVLIDPAALDILPPEITRRLLQAALRWIAGGDYPPRSAALDRFTEALRAGDAVTLAGVFASPAKGMIRLTREPGAVAALIADPGTPWDGRWQVDGPFGPGDQIRATGAAGLRAVPDWRETGLSRTTLMAAPAVWQGEDLRAAPLAGHTAGFTAKLIRTAEDFRATLRTH
ncbi:tRNA lysidine(34) synthetase TilS [Pseudooceanicola onchidii]|uniref:tRNA lysidine(34) synthetase TilS n=1 Tax=Pseudooceanicola onchidii TaxID=2562279 RepID=UPI0010A9B6B2|nr:tRNA lysidine(34) synthetase TilS [Pseudooceanicola onchidii]